MIQTSADTVKNILKQHHLFSKLTDLQLDRVYQHCKIKKLNDGQMLFNQAEPVSSFFMVITGKIKLFRISPDGQEKIIEIVKNGDVFAEALMFSDQSDYPVSAGALIETDVLCLDAKHFRNMLWDSTDTCLLLLSDMSFRLRKMVNEIDHLTLHSGTCRVAAYLVERMPDDNYVFELDMAKNVIAARLSIKPETFSRIFKRLKNLGILSIDGNIVTIHDADALKLQCQV